MKALKQNCKLRTSCVAKTNYSDLILKDMSQSMNIDRFLDQSCLKVDAVFADLRAGLYLKILASPENFFGSP